MWKMLQLETPEDFVIATGELRKLEDFIALAFSSLQLDWREHVKTDPALFRPSDILTGFGDPERAFRMLGWQAKNRLEDIVKMMVDAERGAG
jgi:GDPmannose 4,6-dehydratase